MQPGINPFYTAPLAGAVSTPARPRRGPVYALLPEAPVNASPVPHLTSLYHNPDPGPWGDRSYPGNCSGNLIRDLLLYFKPASVFDPFSGSGTCKEVCDSLGIPCTTLDIRFGLDACSPSSYPRARRFDLVWSHPPYWRQKLYTKNPRDLSQLPTLEAFLERYRRFIENCAGVLSPGGKFAILVGDYSDRECGFVPLTYHSQRLAFAAGLRMHCTPIIRFSHGASSGRKVYRSRFIAGLHDTLLVLELAPGGEEAAGTNDQERRRP